MRILLLAGLGPYARNSVHLEGSLFHDPRGTAREEFRSLVGHTVALENLVSTDLRRPVLRPRNASVPSLSSLTLMSILDGADCEYQFVDLEDLWAGTEISLPPGVDLVAISTTFIVDARTLARAVRWAVERFPEARIAVGGQYSNLKYAEILSRHAEVSYVIRGDGEASLPALVSAFRGSLDFTEVPNLVFRDDHGAIVQNHVGYIDIEAHPSPVPLNAVETMPYESMRGCPFHCRFCSFPSASPKWRFKSAEKIVGDWKKYKEQYGANLISAMDSTFSTPGSRFRKVLDLLPSASVSWDAFARADAIDSVDTVAALERSGCRSLSIGFESMSDSSLVAMEKGVRASSNRLANELLGSSSVDLRASFMVGYPGETPEAYELTENFLVSEFRGQFLLNVFAILDETMPLWKDAEEHGLRVADPDDPERGWVHHGMDADMARSLQGATMARVRWQNDDAVLYLWQMDQDLPLLPNRPPHVNLRAEKLIERLAFLARDYSGNPSEGRRQFVSIMDGLAALGIGVDVPIDRMEKAAYEPDAAL